MKKITGIVLFAAAAVACGSGDSGTTGTNGGADASAVSAARVVEDVEAGKDAEATAAPDPSVASCLDLVRAGRLLEAVAPCTEALRNAPDNRDVAAALGRAKAAAAEQASAAAQAAVDGAGAVASDAAANAVDESANSLTKGLP